MNILSLFDGISCGQLALQRAGFKIDNYYASEIKKNAINVTQDNFPNTIQIGDVNLVDFKIYKDKNIDLLIGGSPCQNLSIAMQSNKRKGLNGDKSILFWKFAEAYRTIKPKYFLLENVSRMPKKDKMIISETLNTEPLRINSSLVSAQLRDRLYWTNIPNAKPPKDKNIKLQNILTSGYTDREKSRALLSSDSRPLKDTQKMWHRYKNTGFTTIVFENKNMNHEEIRYFNQTELERLQTLPEGYTKILNRNQAADVIGDGWTVDVIAHIFKNLSVIYNIQNTYNNIPLAE